MLFPLVLVVWYVKIKVVDVIAMGTQSNLVRTRSPKRSTGLFRSATKLPNNPKVSYDCFVTRETCRILGSLMFTKIIQGLFRVCHLVSAAIQSTEAT